MTAPRSMHDEIEIQARGMKDDESIQLNKDAVIKLLKEYKQLKEVS